jgi:hypothetical protein
MLACAGRAGSARLVYRRVIAETGPMRGTDARAEQELELVLVSALIGLARLVEPGDASEALVSWRVVADSPRFALARSYQIDRLRAEACHAAARILSALGQTEHAAEYARRASELD